MALANVVCTVAGTIGYPSGGVVPVLNAHADWAEQLTAGENPISSEPVPFAPDRHHVVSVTAIEGPIGVRFGPLNEAQDALDDDAASPWWIIPQGEFMAFAVNAGDHVEIDEAASE